MALSISFLPDQPGDRCPDDASRDIHQSHPDSCTVKAEQVILQKHDIHYTEDELRAEAYTKGVFTPSSDGQEGGTPQKYVGSLLEAHGLPVEHQPHANIFGLMKELEQGHDVMVAVDANALWHPDQAAHPGHANHAAHQDPFSPHGNHTVIVTGLDNSVPGHEQVIVMDPGTGEAAKHYPVNQFLDSWRNSGYYMVSTTDQTADHAVEHAADHAVDHDHDHTTDMQDDTHHF